MKFLRFLIPCGLVGTLIGALLFKLLDAQLVAGLVGGITLPFPAQRLRFSPQPDSPPPKWPGALLTVNSGFSNFFSPAGGTPLSAYAIPLRPSPSSWREHRVFIYAKCNGCDVSIADFVVIFGVFA